MCALTLQTCQLDTHFSTSEDRTRPAPGLKRGLKCRLSTLRPFSAHFHCTKKYARICPNASQQRFLLVSRVGNVQSPHVCQIGLIMAYGSSQITDTGFIQT